MSCPPMYLAGATKDLAMRIAEAHSDLVRFALEAMSIDEQSVAINLTLAARELLAAKTKLATGGAFPVEHTRS